MTAYRVFEIRCDHRAPPSEGRPHGYRDCDDEFKPPYGKRYEPLAVLRREAARQGWTYVRHPRHRALDCDLCPEHKPAPEESR